MPELPKHLKDFEGMFYPGHIQMPTSPSDTLTLENPLPVEGHIARARRIGGCVMNSIVRSRRTRSYGLGIGLGSAAVATGIAVAFLTPQHTELPRTGAKEHQLIIKPVAPTHSTLPQPSRTPGASPTDIFRTFRPHTIVPATPTYHEATSTAPSSVATKKPQPAPTWSATSPAVPLPTESTPTATQQPTDSPPSGTPSLPLQTPSETTSAAPEMPPTSLPPSPGD